MPLYVGDFGVATASESQRASRVRRVGRGGGGEGHCITLKPERLRRMGLGRE